MSFLDLTSGKSAATVAFEREYARQELLRSEHDRHEALQGVLRNFGADLPPGKELFDLWVVNREGAKPR